MMGCGDVERDAMMGLNEVTGVEVRAGQGERRAQSVVSVKGPMERWLMPAFAHAFLCVAVARGLS